jgi:hypothetical protein
MEADQEKHNLQQEVNPHVLGRIKGRYHILEIMLFLPSYEYESMN